MPEVSCCKHVVIVISTDKTEAKIIWVWGPQWRKTNCNICHPHWVLFSSYANCVLTSQLKHSQVSADMFFQTWIYRTTCGFFLLQIWTKYVIILKHVLYCTAMRKLFNINVCTHTCQYICMYIDVGHSICLVPCLYLYIHLQVDPFQVVGSTRKMELDYPNTERGMASSTPMWWWHERTDLTAWTKIPLILLKQSKLHYFSVSACGSGEH